MHRVANVEDVIAPKVGDSFYAEEEEIYVIYADEAVTAMLDILGYRGEDNVGRGIVVDEVALYDAAEFGLPMWAEDSPAPHEIVYSDSQGGEVVIAIDGTMTIRDRV
jgi:hypothetical protein